ncbi:MAG: sulfotransferase [Kofleriaceae bacterium]
MRAVFIGGAGRSGTTLLGDLLGATASHICTPETSYKIQLAHCGWAGENGDLVAGLAKVRAHPKFADLNVELPAVAVPTLPTLFDAVVPAYAVKVGKPNASIWIDHTPSNLAIGGALLKQFPDARLIHLVRDGRAVAASQIPLDWGPNSVTGVAREWVLYVALGLGLEHAYPARVHRVAYEELVAEPARVLQRICQFADLTYDSAMLEGGGLVVPHRTSQQHSLVGKRPDPTRMQAWRTALRPREIEIFEAEVSSLLELLGYQPIYGQTARGLSPSGSLAYAARDLAREVTVNRIKRRRRFSG